MGGRAFDGLIIGSGHHGLILGSYLARAGLKVAGGAISGGGGYISARLIADDLSIAPWWKPVDARSSLEALATVNRGGK